jgi:hypothetical protein
MNKLLRHGRYDIANELPATIRKREEEQQYPRATQQESRLENRRYQPYVDLAHKSNSQALRERNGTVQKIKPVPRQVPNTLNQNLAQV